jgi:hypothetical protein
MRISLGVLALTAVVLGGQTTLAQTRTYRTLNDTFAPPHFTSIDAWNQRAAHIRELILESAGLMPMPERTPLGAQVFGEIKRDDYSVSKVVSVLRKACRAFLPRGILYRPVGGWTVSKRFCRHTGTGGVTAPPRKLGHCRRCRDARSSSRA